MKFIRYGNLTLLRQYVDRAPAKKGIWALPYGFFSDYLLMSTNAVSHPSQKSSYLRDDDGNKIRRSEYYVNPDSGDYENYRGYYSWYNIQPQWWPMLKRRHINRSLCFPEMYTSRLRILPPDVHWTPRLNICRFPSLRDDDGQYIEECRFYRSILYLLGISCTQISSILLKSPSLEDFFKEIETKYDYGNGRKERFFYRTIQKMGITQNWRNAQRSDIKPDMLKMLDRRRISLNRVVPETQKDFGYYRRRYLQDPYMIYYRPPHRFEYNGCIWSHLGRFVKHRDVLQVHGSEDSNGIPTWVYTTMKTYEKALKVQCEIWRKFGNIGGFHRIDWHALHAEVFIDENI